MSKESIRARKTKEALVFQRRISLAEIFVLDNGTPLAETEVETGEVTREVPLITRMIEKNPLITLLRRGGHA